MNKFKNVSCLISALIMTASISISAFPASAAEQLPFNDINGHWAKESILEWSGHKVIAGHDGKFKPNAPTTRGDFCIMLNQLMGYEVASEKSFPDLSNEYYAPHILKVMRAGVMSGATVNGVTYAKAKDLITRQDAFLMIFNMLQLKPIEDAPLNYKDAAQISDYAKPAIATLSKMGILSGNNGFVYPKQNLTRAQAATIFSTAISSYYDKAGTYNKDESGLVVVRSADVILKDMTVNGTLLVAPGVGNGDLTLDNVSVTGNVVIQGGGENSIKLMKKFVVGGLLSLFRDGKKVRLLADKDAVITLPSIEVKGGDVVLTGKFSEVKVTGDSKITIVGSVATLKADAPVKITGKVEKVVLTAGAEGTTFSEKPKSIEAPNGLGVSIGNSNYIVSGGSLVVDTGNTGNTGGGSTLSNFSVTPVLLTKAGTGTAVSFASDAFDLSLQSGLELGGLQLQGLPAGTTIMVGNSVVSESNLANYFGKYASDNFVSVQRLKNDIAKNVKVSLTLSNSSYNQKTILIQLNLGFDTYIDATNLLVTENLFKVNNNVVSVEATGLVKDKFTTAQDFVNKLIAMAGTGSINVKISSDNIFTDNTARILSSEGTSIVSDIITIKGKTWDNLEFSDLSNLYFEVQYSNAASQVYFIQ